MIKAVKGAVAPLKEITARGIIIGIILAQADPIITVGAIVAARLYGKACPVVVCGPGVLAQLRPDVRMSLVATADGARLNLSAAA